MPIMGGLIRAIRDNSVKYYIASDLLNGGYAMDEFTWSRREEVWPLTQYHRLFNNQSLEEALKGRIDLKRKAYEYSRNYMITHQVAQANYLYACSEFRKFSPAFKSFLVKSGVDYSIYDDLFQYMIKNGAPPTLIEQFSDVLVYKADNKDFFEWSEARHGMLMPDSRLLQDLLQLQRRTLKNHADFDGDGTVGFGDFIQFAGKFGLSEGDEGYDVRFDLDRDGTIGFSDFLILAGAFGKS